MKKRNLLFGLICLFLVSGCHSKYKVVEYPELFDVKNEKRDFILDKMEGMSIEEKVGQLFFARMPVSSVKEDIEKYHLGGYILFDANLNKESYDSLKKKIASYQSVSDIPLFIASDEEGGSVSRLSSQKIVKPAFQSPLNLFNKGGLDAVLADSKAKSEILLDLGINLNLAPVVDYTNDKSSFIFYRTLGQSFDKTLEYISLITKQMNDQKLGSTLKHFPGYGHNEDSHLDLVYDKRSIEEIEKDLLLFKEGVMAGTNAIMVSHNMIQAIDKDKPASISDKVISMIRTDLNFQGIVMTDDLDMKGITKYTGQNQAAFQAIKAGNDLVMTSQYQKQIPYIIEQINNNQLSMERLDESVYRILSVKYDLDLFK